MTAHARSEHPRGHAAARRLRERAKRFLAALGREEAELSVLIVTDDAIRALNKKWRRKDRATDVLSFPVAPVARPFGASDSFLGDVVVSLDTAERVAGEEGRPLTRELDRYLAHGILHLLGHGHDEPGAAREMSEQEAALVGEGMLATSVARRGEKSRPSAAPRGRGGPAAPEKGRPEPLADGRGGRRRAKPPRPK